MNDIAVELAKLHVLKGADYSRQVERIARMDNFHPVENETGIFSVGGEGGDDYDNLLKLDFNHNVDVAVHVNSILLINEKQDLPFKPEGKDSFLPF